MDEPCTEKETLRQMGIVNSQYTYNLFAALAEETTPKTTKHAKARL